MRENRIRKRREYLNCYERGLKAHSAHFILYGLHEPGMGKRYGIAVSRKVGNAVVRNRIKRVLREFFRLNFSILPELQIVIVAKKNVIKINPGMVEAEIFPLLQQMKSRESPQNV